MSTFHKSDIIAFKQRNYQALENTSIPDLEKLTELSLKMTHIALELETLLLSKARSFKMNLPIDNPYTLTSVASAINQVIHSKLLHVESDQELFTPPEFI